VRFEGAQEAVAAGTDPHAVAVDLVAEMSDAEKLWCLDGDVPCWAGLGYLANNGYHKSPFPAARVPRLGVPGFAFADGPRGVVIGPATCFPVSMARGATWDPELETRVGEAIGEELRAVGATLFGGVCVNVLRHPAWGRAQETYGEDPFHVGEMGAALTRGVQRHAMACVKHLACNSIENARFKVDVTVDETALHEVYLPHFKRIVDEGVAVVMSAYNSVNGDFCGENRALLTDLLRDEWGFRGFVISDWIFGIRDAGRSLAAGLDVEMPYRMIRATHLEEAIRSGEASWAEVDGSVARIVATLLRFDAVLSAPAPEPSVLACPAHRALAREVATRSVVLLRNEPVGSGPVASGPVASGPAASGPVLPVDPATIGTLAVVGPLAAAVNLGDGGSSDVWARDAVTILDGLREALPGSSISFSDGSSTAATVAAARDADAAIVVAGYTYLDEGEYIGRSGTAHLAHLLPGPDVPDLAARFEAEVAPHATVRPPPHVAARPSAAGFATGGDRASLRLHDADVALIRAVAAANPRTIVTIVAGSPVVISEWDHHVPAVLQSWYAGTEGGRALADIIVGRAEPSGRLPCSVPRVEAHLPTLDADADTVAYDRWHGWWRLERDGHAPAYPFGWGLGYTTFVLEEARAVLLGTGIRITATVRNTGGRSGSDVVQVYAHRRGSDRPRRLIGFGRVDVDPGDRAEVRVDVAMDALAERDVHAHAMVVRSGTYDLRIARHAADPGISTAVHVPSRAGGGPSATDGPRPPRR